MFSEEGEKLWEAYVEGPVTHVAWSPGGDKLAVATGKGWVYLFDMSGSRLGRHGVRGEATTVAWNPNRELWRIDQLVGRPPWA